MHLPDQNYTSSNIVQIRPQENITGAAFNGTATFIIDICKDELILPQSIYMAGRVTLSSSESVIIGGAVAQANLPLGRTSIDVLNTKPVGCIASNGLNNLFSKAQHEISGLNGSSVVQNIENYQQTCSLLRLNHEHPNIATKNTADPFILRKYSEMPYNTDFFGDANNVVLKQSAQNLITETPIEYVVKNAAKQGTDQNHEFSLSTVLPFAMFMQENKMYQGQHILRFTIDSEFRKKFVNVINVVGKPSDVGAASIFNGNYSETGGASNQVSVSIKDLYLYVQYVKINLPMGRPIGKHLHVFESWNTTLHSCTSGSNSDNFILPCKPNLLKIIMGFRRNTVLRHAGGYAASLLNPEQIGFNQINLNQLYVKYLSDTYPQTQYSMQLLNSIPEVFNSKTNRYNVSRDLTSNFDTIRAYEDYIINSEFENPEDSMTFDQWKQNSIFVFKFCNTTNQSSNIEINLTCNNSTGPLFDSSTGDFEPAIQSDNELNGAILYLLYIYRTVVESDFGEDSVTYKVYNVI